MTTDSKPTLQPAASTSPPQPLPEVDPSVRLGFRWFLGGFALLGLSVGILAGNSNSPVVGVVLPLLFGLVGGASGFHLAKADITSATEGRRLRYLGVALIAFILPLLLGSAYGVLLRTGLPVGSLLPKTMFVSRSSPDPLPLVGKSAHEAIQLTLMRARLRALGTSEAEQQTILRRVVEDQTAFQAPGSSAQAFGCLAALIDRVVACIPDTSGEKVPSDVVGMRHYLVVYSKNLKDFAGRAESGETIVPQLAEFVIGTVKDYLDKRFEESRSETMKYISENDSFRQTMADLRFALFEEADRFGGNPSLNRPKVIQELDAFLGMFSGDATKFQGVLASKPNLGPSMAR